MTSASSGLVLVDKPAGVTSQQAVVHVRRSLGVDRAGHTGTLDPFATGLLLVLVGRATRLAPFVQDEPKDYEALIRFGVETDTDDVTGEAVRTSGPPNDTVVREAIAALTGDIDQVPPAFSAKHIDGRRAYALARRGKPPELRPVRVRVERWEILSLTAGALRARIRCRSGTYIRALARDLGRLTESAAHCAELRRLTCGAFSVAAAVPPDGATMAHLRPPLAAVAGLATQELDDAAALGIAHGRATSASVAGDRAALVKGGELLAVAERDGDRWLPRVVLSDPSNLVSRA
ncbi:MAG TPA: tRNA pseudouridine(55) synthase TruB [Gemmatimonadaceae bacterium]|nr:tRNA pseudouridine(55) synthase TruB [Gemmatimonadaceae bacterium]